MGQAAKIAPHSLSGVSHPEAMYMRTPLGVDRQRPRNYRLTNTTDCSLLDILATANEDACTIFGFHRIRIRYMYDILWPNQNDKQSFSISLTSNTRVHPAPPHHTPVRL